MTNEPPWMNKRLRINIINSDTRELVGFIDEKGIEHVVKEGWREQRSNKVKNQPCQ